ncbi:MAG: hypothetical protein Q4F24_09160 [Eubacteriales bacterium]|nr:hypothetical protein [Eubacteriales bacterium]
MKTYDKNRKKTPRVIWWHICCLGIMVLSIMLMKTPVKAATSGVTTLQTNKTYQSYDLDGDGKKDSIQMRTSQSGYKMLASVYVNGKKVYNMPNNHWWQSAGIKMITLGNGKNFVYAWMEGESMSCDRILQYKNKKMSTVVDINNLMKKYQSKSYVSWYPSNGIKVSGNTMSVKVSSMNWTIAGASFIFQYKYKDGTLKRVSYSGVIENSGVYIVDKKFPVYKKAGSSLVSFTANYGQKVTANKYYLKDGKMWIKLTNSAGKSGWIKALTTGGGKSRSPLFSNAFYAS